MGGFEVWFFYVFDIIVGFDIVCCCFVKFKFIIYNLW